MRILTVLFLSFLISSALLADYDEAVDGDISGDRLSPTVIDVVDGSNLITATAVGGDRDYFTITVPVGATLDALHLTAFTSANIGFIAFQEGATFSANPSIPDFLGWSHLALPLEDKLPVLAASTASGAMGFDIPLPAGTYTFWSQETGPSPTTYTLDFRVSIPTVPTLSEWSVIVLTLLMMICTVVGVRSTSVRYTA